MENSERALLLNRQRTESSTPNLSLLFAIICIVDVFGVFPIVSLPKAVIDCGWKGIPLVIFVCSLQMYTAVLLGKCWIIAEEIQPRIQSKNRYPYSALAEITYGETLAKIVTFLLDATILCAGIPNLILASQNLQLVGMNLTNNEFNMSFCYWMIIIGMVMCPFLWLGSPKDMKCLCTVSVCIVSSVFILIFLSIISDDGTASSARTMPYYSQPYVWQNLLSGYGIITFQYDIHPTILTILVDMQNKMEIGKAVLGGFFVSLGFFSITCLAVYVHFGTEIGPSILEMLPSTITVHFCAILVAVQLMLSSAIGNSALYQHIEDYFGIPREFNYKRCIMRSVVAVFSIILAESVPRFDLVMSLLGGALTGPLVYLLPPLFFMRMLTLQDAHLNTIQMEAVYNTAVDEKDTLPTDFGKINHGYFKIRFRKAQVAFCMFIISCGFCTTLATTYWNIVNTIRYVHFSPPCIVNIYNSTQWWQV
ncbi:hypothetical protein PPYR_08327 [Photinus pyralis]|uniref:Amino acid transporter transmembrane domain-containing protein n=1 Tax=Photinus pyralis TaxID=7054 RepID=A0A5N3ZZD9_PHOPY|nr:amino acid transporter AVT1B-like [Photinus pyralis]XP_031358478.1 amino acid transporter AVT1B-like [Photinus pyralis]KAB0790426.1 hypothetical protein PPYR_15204 [Photinus pyralis]KAB0797333.1 hypothetical protein PPYR_08327 [Photinus pyralis]